MKAGNIYNTVRLNDRSIGDTQLCNSGLTGKYGQRLAAFTFVAAVEDVRESV